MEDSRVQMHVASYYQTKYQATELPIPLVRIEATGRFDFRGVWRLYRCIEEYRPHIVHVHHTVSAFWAALFGKLSGSKIVRSEHSNSQFHTPVQRGANVVSRSLSDLVLCNSKNTYLGLPKLQKRNIGNKYKIVYNGVDAKKIKKASSVSPPFEIKDSIVTVGSVGRLIDEKNYERFLKAFAHTISVFGEKIRLVLVGDGKNRSQIEHEISRLGISEQVTLTGEVEREDVYAALHAFDIFVMTSLSEGFCNAAVEAMAAGLPLLCSNIPTLREVMGEVAVFADPVDPYDMSESLLELLNEGEEHWEERGRKARQLAVEKYSVERTAQEYIQSYLELSPFSSQ
jgi:glycosyltransferase involved in cell wall biosynthesis